MGAKFKKSEQSGLLEFIKPMLEMDDMEVFVVRDKWCKILFANKRAETRIESKEVVDYSCKSVYSSEFTALCKFCPHGGNLLDGKKKDNFIEVTDKNGHTYTFSYKEITWVDGKPATIIYLYDITAEKRDKDQLYSLAYVDQLTFVPNRQKLKQEFSALEEKIEMKKISGAFALFDIDNFKEVNDLYGHSTGDVILRRLAEHFLSDKMYADYFYRLGGDEFVLLFSNDANMFETEEALREHYKTQLEGALQVFTLPNITLKCTLSIGVSFFPEHGAKYSELVGKADIAMYRAKEEGRNRIVLFEEQYDIAKKFKDLYINIKPVLREGGDLFGYELIDGDNSENIEEEESTVMLSELNRAMDALGLGEINNSSHYFISYTKQLLNPTVLENLPRDKFIVVLPITSKITKKELSVYAQLSDRGYKLVAKQINNTIISREILEMVDYCILDLAGTNPVLYKSLIELNPSVGFIGSGIDTPFDFLAAKKVGFKLFQGFYFTQPIISTKAKDMDPLKANYYRLLKLSLTDDYMDFREICSIISSDVSLTYKLLKILNSAAIGLRNVHSIAMAVVYMGEESLRKWIAVLAVRGVAEDKPLELVRMSLIRARFGELLAPHFRIQRDPEQVFMVGMLSLLHIALDMTKQQMLEEMPVSDEIRMSLLTKAGIHSDLLRFYENFEYANWEDVSLFAIESQLDSQFINDSYIAAVKWTNELTSGS